MTTGKREIRRKLRVLEHAQDSMTTRHCGRLATKAESLFLGKRFPSSIQCAKLKTQT